MRLRSAVRIAFVVALAASTLFGLETLTLANPAAAATMTAPVTVSCKDGPTTITVPTDAIQMHISETGGQGGAGDSKDYGVIGHGGHGSRVTATLPVGPTDNVHVGDSLVATAGCEGHGSLQTPTTYVKIYTLPFSPAREYFAGGAGYYPGGMGGSGSECTVPATSLCYIGGTGTTPQGGTIAFGSGGGGGGASGVFDSSTSTLLALAGGGGGGGESTCPFPNSRAGYGGAGGATGTSTPFVANGSSGVSLTLVPDPNGAGGSSLGSGTAGASGPFELINGQVVGTYPGGGGGGGGGGVGAGSGFDCTSAGGGGGGMSEVNSSAINTSFSTSPTATPGTGSIDIYFSILGTPPFVSITSPGTGSTYTYGQTVGTRFGCGSSVGIASCDDSNGLDKTESCATVYKTVGNTGTLNTKLPDGPHTYTVNATG
ncbi:MAG: hypothetical protein ACYDHU_11140, partial [Acidimicrobiales bacterium]